MDRPVMFGDLITAFKVMESAVASDPPEMWPNHVRMHLMKYLDDWPVPLTLNGTSWRLSVLWDILPAATGQKLDALLGPHGYAVAKAFIARQSE